MRIPTPKFKVTAAAVAVLASATALTAASAVATGAAGAAAVPQPVIKLVTAQNDLTLDSSGGAVAMDPGIWVASAGAPLELQVWRSGYAAPQHITQILHGSSGRVVRRTLPANEVLPNIPLGLNNFLIMTVRDAAGKVVDTESVLFCPNTTDPERLTPDGPDSSPYPASCATDPFPVGSVWGIQKNWAVDPVESYLAPQLDLSPGTYHVTETIARTYIKLFHVTAADAKASADVTVVAGQAGGQGAEAPQNGARPPAGDVPGAGAAAQDTGNSGQSAASSDSARLASASPPAPEDVPNMPHPPAAALPKLVTMPSWGITTSDDSGTDLLNFSSTVWNGGHAPLDVEGYRTGGSPVMQAYQYFYLNGRVIGKAPAGTMGFDSMPGHNHWHFEQFAQYRLLSAGKKLAAPSQKVGFCIAPTDPVDTLLPGTVWQPPVIGLTGQCGSPTALWVQELLQVGWGDTYTQIRAGQSFDITKIPNGTYYIEVIANPERVLHVTSNADDISLRKVILGGTPGNRTVTVPAVDGIDPES